MTKKAKELLDKKIRHLDNMDCQIKRDHRFIDNLSLFVTDKDEAYIVVSDCSQRNDNVVADNTWEENIPRNISIKEAADLTWLSKLLRKE
tara:strand:- start:815 stop:1084 length:270 start_codon:yes stop_codon:yes gene_type:complete